MMWACSNFMERCRSQVCHICLQPRSAHPGDYDRVYWAEWLVLEILLELQS